MAVLGLGYLLGQVYDRRAFALLFWVGLGLLPALLSDAPADRRMSIMFPALYVVVGVLVGADVRLVRRCAGRVLAAATGALLAVAGARGGVEQSGVVLPAAHRDRCRRMGRSALPSRCSKRAT